MNDKIIFTQKSRISSLEHDLDEFKRHISDRDDELRTNRTNHDRSKERLVEQIIGLSDKFADINQRMLDIANENSRLKVLVRDNKTSLALAPKKAKKEDLVKAEIGKAVSSAKKAKKRGKKKKK